VAVAAPIDECLSIADGRLQIEGCDAGGLAERFGTPISVISEDHVRRNARRFVRALAAAWPEGTTRVLPSIKANYTLAVRSALTQEGLGCDVFGPAELHAALAGGVPPALISVNGTGKTRLLDHCVGIGARIASTAFARSSSCAPSRATSAAGRRCASAFARATSISSSARTSHTAPSTRRRRSTSRASRARS
jgi:hypothetical protein